MQDDKGAVLQADVYGAPAAVAKADKDVTLESPLCS